jgi:hypothetical protein
LLSFYLLARLQAATTRLYCVQLKLFRPRKDWFPFMKKHFPQRQFIKLSAGAAAARLNNATGAFDVPAAATTAMMLNGNGSALKGEDKVSVAMRAFSRLAWQTEFPLAQENRLSA